MSTHNATVNDFVKLHIAHNNTDPLQAYLLARLNLKNRDDYDEVKAMYEEEQRKKIEHNDRIEAMYQEFKTIFPEEWPTLKDFKAHHLISLITDDN